MVTFFKSTLLFQALTSLFIIINCVLIWSAFVVELQIRTHGSVGAIQPLILDPIPSIHELDIESAPSAPVINHNYSSNTNSRAVSPNGHIENNTGQSVKQQQQQTDQQPQQQMQQQPGHTSDGNVTTVTLH